MTEVLNTTYLHNSRPFIVRAEAQTTDGRHVEGIGSSYLTRERAADKAISNAEDNADRFDVGFQVMNIDYRKTVISILEDEHRIQSRSIMVPPYKVRVSAYQGDKSVDATSSGWLRFNGTVGSAISNAESQLGRLG